MREIKFRAWNNSEKTYWNNFNVFIHNNFLIDRDNDDLVLEQFTGLKDKNGVEIYEGDVLMYDYQNPQFGPKTTIRVVRDMVEWTGHERVIEEEYNIIYDYEIIGNIHEATPEQLKEWGIKNE